MDFLEDEKAVTNIHADGWTKWGGGGCPVGIDVVVDIVTRGGGKETGPGGMFRWNHEVRKDDIVAYRLSGRKFTATPSEQCIAADVLRNGADHIEDRAKVYDKDGERSIPATVAAFNAITGSTMTAEQGWLFMALLKAVRSQQGEFKQDNYEDGAAYFALMCEQAKGDR